MSMASFHGARALAAAVGVLILAGCTASPGSASATGSTPRDRHWQQDIAYLAQELPSVRVAGLGPVPAATWDAAAQRLEAQVPRLTDVQVEAGMARMIAMLHDDETLLLFPPAPLYPLDAEWFGGSLFLVGVPGIDPQLLGTEILAVDGLPIARVAARLGALVDYEDTGILRATQAGYLDDAGLLYSLGITTSPVAETLTVRTATGRELAVPVTAGGSGYFTAVDDNLFTVLPGVAHGPVPLYLQNATMPYWLRILPAQQAVYLKYNSCVSDSGFQRLAARALAVLAQHPGYRLVVDLRDNPGGNSQPFLSLVNGIAANPAVNQRGRVFGLINQFTDSSATVDASNLARFTHAVLIGQQVMDPLDLYGNTSTFKLPNSGISVLYTTARVNSTGKALIAPDVAVTPTPAQAITGRDPVLAAALSWPSPASG
jgi:hypothetical protein